MTIAAGSATIETGTSHNTADGDRNITFSENSNCSSGTDTTYGGSQSGQTMVSTSSANAGGTSKDKYSVTSDVTLLASGDTLVTGNRTQFFNDMEHSSSSYNITDTTVNLGTSSPGMPSTPGSTSSIVYAGTNSFSFQTDFTIKNGAYWYNNLDVTDTAHSSITPSNGPGSTYDAKSTTTGGATSATTTTDTTHNYTKSVDTKQPDGTITTTQVPVTDTTHTVQTVALGKGYKSDKAELHELTGGVLDGGWTGQPIPAAITPQPFGSAAGTPLSMSMSPFQPTALGSMPVELTAPPDATIVALGFPLGDAANPASGTGATTRGKATGATDRIFGDENAIELNLVCFAAGTNILTDRGPVPIERILPGDRVLSVSDLDPEGPATFQPVAKVFHNPPARLLNVHVGDFIIRPTFNHPFYVLNKGWTAAAKLIPGDHIRTRDGKSAVVTDVFDNGDIEPVFNFSVPNGRTYFVGNERTAVLVHNESGDPEPTAIEPPRGSKFHTDETGEVWITSLVNGQNISPTKLADLPGFWDEDIVLVTYLRDGIYQVLYRGGATKDVKGPVPIPEQQNRLNAENQRSEAGTAAMTAGIELVSLVPGLGDGRDAYEFAAGKDVYGNPLSTTDKAVTGVAMVVPFVPGSWARATTNAAIAMVPSSVKNKIDDAAGVVNEWAKDWWRKRPDLAPEVPTIKGTLTGAVDELKPDERTFLDELLEAGKDVDVIPTAKDRTPDFKIDGVLHELKTLSNVQKQTPDGLSAAIANRVMNGRGQAAHIIVDARKQAGMTREIAERGAKRAFGADNKTGGKIQSIRIIGDGFDITIPRVP